MMVARSTQGKERAVRITPLETVTDEERARFAAGQKRAARRKEKSVNSLSVKPPESHEISLIHRLYLESQRHLRNGSPAALSPAAIAVCTTTTTTTTSSSNSPSSAAVDEHHQDFQRMRHGNIKYMKQMIFKNVLLMHPQSRNVHCKVFGI